MSKTESPLPGFALDRRFGVSLAIGLALATALSLIRTHCLAAGILGFLSALSLALGLARPRLLTPIRLVLERLVSMVATLIAIAILSVFYCTIFTAFSALTRLFRKDALRDRHPRWHPVPQEENEPGSLKRLF